MNHTKDQIIKSTIGLLAHHGFHGFSMKQVAKTAGVASGTVYVHFDSKDALIQQIQEKLLSELAVCLFGNMHKTEAPFEELQIYWSRLWNFCMKNPDALLCKEQFEHLPQERKKQELERKQQLFKPLYAYFEQGKNQQIIKNICNEMLFSLTLDVCLILARKHITGLVKINEAAIEQAFEACCDAIRYK